MLKHRLVTCLYVLAVMIPGYWNYEIARYFV